MSTSMTIQSIIDADFDATKKKVVLMNAVDKVASGRSSEMTTEETSELKTALAALAAPAPAAPTASAPAPAAPREMDVLIDKLQAVTPLDDTIRKKYASNELQPLREALANPSQALDEWKQKGSVTTLPDDFRGDAKLASIQNAWNDTSDIHAFVQKEYDQFLKGKPDRMGSSLVVTYMYQNNLGGLTAYMGEGLKIVEEDTQQQAAPDSTVTQPVPDSSVLCIQSQQSDGLFTGHESLDGKCTGGLMTLSTNKTYTLEKDTCYAFSEYDDTKFHGFLKAPNVRL